MKKLIVCFFALCISAGIYAQPAPKDLAKKEAPKEIVTTTTEEVYEEITPEKEAEALTEMMAEATEINADQKKEIYKVVLKSLKEKVKLEPLRTENKEEYETKELEIFKLMNDEINAVITGG